MEEKDVAMILSEKYNKKVQLVENMIKICYKFDCESSEIGDIVEEFLKNNLSKTCPKH